jgi:hypothetical protein
MLASYIVSAWTAFEALAGDLWETAVNEHPATLAHLNGKAARLKKDVKSTEAVAAEDGVKSIRLDLVSRYGFDIRNKMGTIFVRQGRYEFTQLPSIRTAYAESFSKDHAWIDRVLGDKSLDALTSVRNLLVHKGGRADDEYVRRSNGLNIPKLTAGETIQLDGEIVVGLIKPAINCGAELIRAVDAWIEKN